MKLSIIIPAWKEAHNLEVILPELASTLINIKHEVIVINRESGDNTKQVVDQNKCIYVEQQGRGYGNAVSKGVNNATGKWIVFFDADGSYNPNNIPKMLELAESESLDFVYSSRYLPESGSDDDTMIRYIGNFLFTLLGRILFRLKLSDILFLYAIGKREIINNLKIESQDFAWCIELPAKMAMNNFKYAEVPSKERPRIYGESKVNAAWDGTRILWKMISIRLSLGS